MLNMLQVFVSSEKFKIIDVRHWAIVLNMKLLMFLLHDQVLKYVPLRRAKVAILKWPIPLADSAEPARVVE